MRHQYALIVRTAQFCCLVTGLWPLMTTSARAQEPHKKLPATPGPMLTQGTQQFETSDFKLTLVKSSQTIAALKPKGADDFDFTPGDLLVERSQNGYFHLGDITFRLRAARSGAWQNYSSAAARTPVNVLPVSRGELAAADLSPTFPANFPLQVTRSWALETGKLVLRFTLKNRSPDGIQIGALGIPMAFNNVLNDRSLEEAHAKCSFYDPYIGEDAGYLQVTRLSGLGPALLVVPEGKTPFEAYNPILDKADRWGAKPVFTDPTPRGITFEGFYEWMVHTQAYAENEWKAARPWNPATVLELAPGESKTYGLKFLLSDSIRNIEKTLADNGRPVAVGIPGYIVPQNIDARLFLKYLSKVKSTTVDPPGALRVDANGTLGAGWSAYTIQGKMWGRSRLTLTYEDGSVQTIQYFVTKPESQVVADMGRFLTSKAWYEDAKDPFHRSPSVMTYDRELNRIVMQDSRVWIAGLGDEGGGGAWLAAIMKQLVQPDNQELEKLQRFVDGVLWGGLQFKEGPHAYGVRKSLFYYQPDEMPSGYYRSDFDWSTWTSWNKAASERVDRSYDYPHVAAAYWVLYRLARNHEGLVTNHPWDWYLDHAYETSIAMTNFAAELGAFGQMEGDIFLQILLDLKREGRTQQADTLEAKMRARAERWRREAYPFGSEMPWDSTGQEEVYAWTKYFGYEDKAKVTLNAILGYDPTIPHWGYNGSARRYWDFIFAAKDRRLERQLHHYGSGLNAIPVLSEYREHPEDFYLLRVGYGGAMGPLTDIDSDGFPSAAFHGFPDMLRTDPITGDYGPNFFGHAWNTATYVVNHPQFGWLAFGGNLRQNSKNIEVTPLDSYRARVYVAPLGLWLTLEAGNFESVIVDTNAGRVRLGLAGATALTPSARLRIEQPARKKAGAYHPLQNLAPERGAWVVPLNKDVTWIELSAK
jgi:hypothetical protein